VTEPVTNQIGDRDHLQAVFGAEIQQLGDTRHAAVGVHDFADDAAGTKPRQTREINGRFGLACAHEHTAFPSAEGKYMAGPRQVGRRGGRIHGDTDGVRAVGS
jgi:hypothetical protein